MLACIVALGHAEEESFAEQGSPAFGETPKSAGSCRAQGLTGTVTEWGPAWPRVAVVQYVGGDGARQFHDPPQYAERQTAGLQVDADLGVVPWDNN